MKKYKVGIYGVGDVATEYIKAFNKNPLSEVVLAVGRNKKKTEEKINRMGLSLEVITDFDRMVKRNDIDIVVLSGPHFLHAKEAIKAAKAGKHILVEKPIGMSFKETRAVYEAIKKAGVQFQNSFVGEWYPYILNIKKLISDGLMGKIFYIEADYMHNLDHWTTAWLWGVNKRSGGPSAPLIGGIHTIDILRILGGKPLEVFAYQTWGYIREYEYAPTYVAILKFENGVIGKTGCSYEIAAPYHTNFCIYGSKGTIRNEKFFLKETFPGQTDWQKFETVLVDSRLVSHHPFQPAIDDFIKAIENKKYENIGNIDETYRTHELCFAVERSMETGKIVKLPLSG
jgi:predicted dehydrogenase